MDVTTISITEDPPRGRTDAIFWERMPLFLLSIHQASTSHKRKMPRNPDRKENVGFCGIAALTRNAAMAIPHQGIYKPITNAISPVTIIDRIYFNMRWFYNFVTLIMAFTLLSVSSLFSITHNG